MSMQFCNIALEHLLNHTPTLTSRANSLWPIHLRSHMATDFSTSFYLLYLPCIRQAEKDRLSFGG